jgi:hypothetical protein
MQLPAHDRAPVGLATPMESRTDFEKFVPGEIASLGIEADEVELAVMQAAHSLWWPAIAGLLEVDLSGVAPEPEADMSRSPRAS